MNLQRHQAISDNEKKAVLPVWSFYAGISGTTLCMKNESPGRWSSEKSLSYAPSAFFSIQTIKCKKVLAFFFNMCYIIQAVSKALTVWMRGISAVGSAQHWQCWGQEFESPMLHGEESPCEIKGFLLFMFSLIYAPFSAYCTNRFLKNCNII